MNKELYYNIHDGHTKDNLIQIIRQLELQLKYNGKLKKHLLKSVDEWCYEHQKEQLKVNAMGLTSVAKLIRYLIEPPVKSPYYITSSEKQELVYASRRIIGYAQTGYKIEKTIYETFDDLKCDVEQIALMGAEIPSCRRAVKLFNLGVAPDNRVDMILTPEQQHEIKIKSIRLGTSRKPKYPQSLKVKSGKYEIRFD
jgi:hypothetical protein